MLTDAKLAHPDDLKEGAAAKPTHFNEGSDPHTKAFPRPVRARYPRKSGRAGRVIGAAESDPIRTLRMECELRTPSVAIIAIAVCY
jgi:hypothetical protein